MEETDFALRYCQTVSVTKINKLHNNVLFINSLCFLCSWQVVFMPYFMFMQDCKSCVRSWSLSARLIQPTGDCAVRDCHGNRGPVDYRNYHTVANCVNPGCRNAEPHPEKQVFLRLLNLNHEASFRGNSPLKQQEHSLEMWNSWIPTRRGILQWLTQRLHRDMTLPYCISCCMWVVVDFGGVMRGSGLGCSNKCLYRFHMFVLQ